MNIYVGNLTYEASEADVRQVFETFGEVTSVKIITDKYTGQSRGIGFVEMANKKDALTAISDLNGKELKGRALKVNGHNLKTYDNNGGGNGGEIVVLVAVMAVAAVETVAAETEIVKDVAGNYLPRRERIYAFPTNNDNVQNK
ncbi:MAG: RNA-binding protein [Leptospiraceae bacterium]|nr:RNA-binding protein [Leptospiraceae bacterium]